MKRPPSLVLLTLAFGTIASITVADETSVSKSEADLSTLPVAVDLRPQFEEFGLGPRRQGRRNTCSVFTTVAAMEFALARQTDKGEPLSVEYLNWACNQVINNKTQDRGQFFHHLLKAYDKYGICAEADMPYTRRFDPELAPSDEAKQKAKDLFARGFEIHWINPWKRKQGLREEQLTEVKKVLAAGWPLAAGSNHSRLLVGYEDDPEQPGGGILLTKDSGSGKFSQVTYEFARTQINDVFWVELPLNAEK